MKYVKKLVIIEAIQLRWDTWSEICNFANVGLLTDGKPQGCCIGEGGIALPPGIMSDEIGLLIPTLNEFYPCKPDIFDETYELSDNK